MTSNLHWLKINLINKPVIIFHHEFFMEMQFVYDSYFMLV